MLSEVLDVYDMTRAVREWDWKSKADEAGVQQKIYAISLGYRSYAPADVIEREDIVKICLNSQLSKYNRTVSVRVGDGLFDKSLEELLIGKSAGQSFDYFEDGVLVRCHIIKAERLVVPALTDQMAMEQNIDGITSASALYGHYMDESLKNSLFFEAKDFLLGYIKKCSFDIKQRDIDELCERELERCRKISKGMSMVFDEMTPDQLTGAVGCRSIPEFHEKLLKIYNENLRIALVYAQTADGNSGLKDENVNEFSVLMQRKAAELAFNHMRAEV